MNESLSPTGATQGWDSYWQGAFEAKTYTGGVVCHPFFAEYWKKTLAELISQQPTLSILDVATGSGAVVECLDQIPDYSLENVTCLDISESAIASVKERFPDVSGIVSDAASIPTETGHFDAITSQFGIEYAGTEAITEVTSLLEPGGHLLLLLHIRGGAIHWECSNVHEAIKRVQQCDFVALARDYFAAGFNAVRGGDRSRYEKAGAALNPALRETESVLSHYGPHIAGDTIQSLYGDVQRIHQRIQHYNADEVIAWLNKMELELERYRSRMDSMCGAAIDDQQLQQLCESLQRRGLSILKSEAMRVAEGELPFAWKFSARKEISL